MDEDLMNEAAQEGAAAAEQQLEAKASAGTDGGESGAEGAKGAEGGGGEGDKFDPLARLTAAIDSIGADADAQGADGSKTPGAEKLADKPAQEAQAKPPAAPAADAAKGDPEEAELLEGVKSERGKDRIRSILGERKQLKQDLQEIQNLVTSTGMKPDEFAQSLEFGRLINSGNDADLRVALEMLEGTRAQLYARLGVEAPGVDLLAQHADLKEAVSNMEMTREHAVELAKLRRQSKEQQAADMAGKAADQESVQFRQGLQQAAGAMESFLQSRSAEVDHIPRMKVLSDHFRDPANLQKFVQTYRPEQWLPTLQWMYSSISVQQRPAPRASEQPLRSRPTMLGARAPSGSDPVQRLAGHIEALGI